MADRPAKHWASSSKPPLRNHRPTSAPQKKENDKPPVLTKQTTTFVRPRPVSPLEDATDLLLVSPIRVVSPKASRPASKETSKQNTPKPSVIFDDSNEILNTVESSDLEIRNSSREIRNSSRENSGDQQNEGQLWSYPSDSYLNGTLEQNEMNQEKEQKDVITNEELRTSPIQEESNIESQEPANEQEISEVKDLKSFSKKRGSMASTYILSPNRSDLGRVLPSLKRPPGILRAGTIRRNSSVSNRPAWGARPAAKLVSKARWIIPTKKQDINSIQSSEQVDANQPVQPVVKEESVKWIDNTSVESDDADSSDSEVAKEDEINIEFQDSNAPPPEQLPVETGSATAKRRLERRKSHAIVIKPNPLLKMSLSQYNLFSNTAGTFRGPGDPYFAFVLGGKSVRPGAKRYKSVKLSEINEGKADEILVDKNANRFNTSSWNHRALTRLRKRYREVVSDEIDRKVGSLEETRAYIITSLYSLKSYQVLLKRLESENQELKKEYGFVLADINVRVSDTLKKNADFINQIKGLQKKGMQERKDLVKEFGIALKTWAEEEQAHLKKIEELNSIYNAKCADLEDLKLFAKETFEDPTISAKRIEFEIERKNDHLKDLQTKLEANRNQFDNLQEDADYKTQERAGRIIEKAANKFESFINSNTKKALFENTHLKSEIARQKKYIKNIEDEIGRLTKEKVVLKQDRPEYFDERRRVLNLKDCMTCTPDMDVELSPYKKLPMIRSQH
ncbi:hypothetical protein HDV06_001835 [Boothiomyces sp. JEL0866]|nr:hypothetical protein HDV06_001835 [Boothiomyces sp. JEL0866]